MNQTQSSTLPRSKTYEITITALMTAVTCSDFLYQPGNLSVPVSSRMEKRNHQLSDLSSDRTRWAPGIFRLHWWSGKTGRAYRRIYHRIYRNGNYCRTGHRQLPQTMASAYRYDRRNHCMLPFRNHMVLRGRRLYFPGSPRSLRHPVYSGRPGKNDYRDAHWTDDKEKNTVIAAVAKVLCKHGL